MSETVTQFYDRQTELDAKATAKRVDTLLKEEVNLEHYHNLYPTKPRPFRDFLLIISAVSLFFTVASAMPHSPDHPIDLPKVKPIPLSSLINEPLNALYSRYTPVPNP